ncbi:MAG: exodeoxyribonuclease V subunit gamma [endosymbiont of Escarpia spicata]|uniref:RecBCD enzyme subunit RecC n=1 Tax=endosymbiont of Escarpia spicata TaxID=2200908 RepID=A0A370DN21_9GAMM|nr:MAG: exodeoxyribonuclease V subunit gamma [endosymbiont of Escarpia spicata]
MLRLYQSNRLEILSLRLSTLLAEPMISPLEEEVLVVQHPGMARWLSLEIAEKLGICANIRFPMPASFVWEVFRAFLPDVSEFNRFEPSLLRWRIFQLLDEIGQEPVFAPVSHYLRKESEKRRFQLADRLAGLFDRYLVYRPDWIRKWDKGESAVAGDEWQAEIWRRLAVDDAVHWVHLQESLFQAMSGDAANPPRGLPARLFLFGVPTLSPGYLEIIRQLSHWMDIHLFLLNPCEAHWLEIMPEGEKVRRELMSSDIEDLYLEVGNPLLASLGRQGRDFFSAINDFDPGSEEWFDDAGGDGCLAGLQREILHLEQPETIEGERDHSVAFHRCHSPMREIEVLYDQLLAMFEEMPDLTPADILVMTPDIDTYAPLIEARFSEPGDCPAIPYRISDRTQGLENPYVTAFLDLLSVPASRYGVDEVLRLLEFPAIQQRFGLDEAGLERIVDWIEQAVIRWGRDAESKLEFDLPADPRNTWRFGLEQLVLGYAMSPNDEALWQGIPLPESAEGSESVWLSGLLGFCRFLFELEDRLSGMVSVAIWCDRLQRMLDRFFAADENAEQPLQLVRDTLVRLGEEAEEAGFQGQVSLSLIRQQLELLFSHGSSRGFLGGGVNFCAFTPMRSLPFKVICLIGMNDGAFPREPPTLDFDLMAKQFRFGDRSRRADDRYLFLETLISARERLYISYVGRSLKDNSALPPSVLVEELRDYMASQVGESGLDRMTFTHPLQPFSPNYFQPEGHLFSYSSRMQEAAQLVGRGEKQRQPLVAAPLPKMEPVTDSVDLHLLRRFYSAGPARAFAAQRLNLRLETARDIPDARETFEMEKFTAEAVERELVERLLSGESAESFYQLLDLRGELPHGKPGRRHYQQLCGSAQLMVERLNAGAFGEEMPPLDVDLILDGLRLSGRLNGLRSTGLLEYSAGKIYPHQRLDLWIRFLALNLIRPEGVAWEAIWLSPDEEGRFIAPENPETHLQQLVAFYRQGLLTPLHFYAGTSWSYAEKWRATEDRPAALYQARKRWFNDPPAHGSKPHHRLLMPGEEMLDEAFHEISLAVFLPLMDHMELVE